jgi:hypothetical protein
MQQIQVQKKILLQDHVSGSIQTSESHKEAFKTEKGQELKTTSYNYMTCGCHPTHIFLFLCTN